MKQKLLSIIAGTVIGCATTTAYAGPTPDCLAARADLGTVMDAILECKNFVPTAPWVCTSPTREVATQEKNDCLAVVRHECRGWPLADGVSCDVDAVIPVEIPAQCPSAEGTWDVTIDWECDGSSGVLEFTYNADGTVTFPSFVPWYWSQDGCAFEMGTVDSFVTYIGTMDGNGNDMDGTMFNQNGRAGCWTATRAGAEPSMAPASASEAGSAGDLAQGL